MSEDRYRSGNIINLEEYLQKKGKRKEIEPIKVESNQDPLDGLYCCADRIFDALCDLAGIRKDKVTPRIDAIMNSFSSLYDEVEDERHRLEVQNGRGA